MKPDQIIRSDRKTFALVVKRDGSLIVRAPKAATEAQIDALIQKKSGWIQQKQQLVSKLFSPATAKEFVNGEGFLFLGKTYQLAIVDDQDMPLRLKDRFYLDKRLLDQAPAIFTQWYKDRAKEIFTERVEWYAHRHGYKYSQIKMMDARTRWGSCGPKGTINLSWRLVMSPMRVIDYVVIHELVHLQERNHSRAYWDRVKIIMPDYQQQVDWLDRNGHLLTIQ